MPSLLLADDHEFVRKGIGSTLDGFLGIEIVGEAGDGIEAMSLARQLQPDLMLLDAAMPMARGVEVFAEVRRWSPQTKVAVVTGFTGSALLADWVQAGVDGLFLKSGSSAELREGVEAILDGRRYISHAALQRIAEHEQVEALTAREREVLSLIGKGLLNSGIAERLHISPKTVEKHRSSLMAKLHVNSVSGLLIRAMRDGLLDEHHQL